MKVLVVEDEKVNRMILVSLLSRQVTTVRQAGDGREALTLLEAEPVDVLITDLSMPRLDGRGLAEELVRRQSLPKTIVLTAYADSETAERHGALADCRFLFKPLREALLIGILDEVGAELGLTRVL